MPLPCIVIKQIFYFIQKILLLISILFHQNYWTYILKETRISMKFVVCQMYVLYFYWSAPKFHLYLSFLMLRIYCYLEIISFNLTQFCRCCKVTARATISRFALWQTPPSRSTHCPCLTPRVLLPQGAAGKWGLERWSGATRHSTDSKPDLSPKPELVALPSEYSITIHMYFFFTLHCKILGWKKLNRPSESNIKLWYDFHF